MGRSRRERPVALTKIRKQKGGHKAKEDVQRVRSLTDKYEHIYILSVRSMRNVLIQKLRAQWKDSTFYFGRKGPIRIALGCDAESEYLKGMYEFSKNVHGNVGLLFTNRSCSTVIDFFNEYQDSDFARSGFKATEHFEVKKGELDRFEPNQVSNLRKIGLPVELIKGVVQLPEDFTVCNVGETLTPEKAKILEFMGIKMAKFQIRLAGHYDKKTGKYKELSSPT